jgi:hypothetical protein
MLGRARIGVPVAVIALLLAAGALETHGRGGDAPSSDRKEYPLQLPDVDASGYRACGLLKRRLAEEVLRSKRLEQRKNDLAPNHETCTYMTPDRRVSVTVALYPARDYDDTVEATAETTADEILGNEAAFNGRLGYLIRLPNKPFYLQATYFHIRHLHAERSVSRVLAERVLGRERTPAGKFICSLTGKPI